MKENKEDRATRVKEIIKSLKKDYPDPQCALIHVNALELLIATILSAQCTDERVNIVTATLFRKYRKSTDYISVSLSELESDIKSINFFRNKAKSIQGACKILSEKYKGEVPQTLEELVELPGVGRKTASVVSGIAFGIPTGVVVDTHVSRLSQRLGLTDKKDAEKIEIDLMGLIPKKEWIQFSLRLILHGRKVCKARKPACDVCIIEQYCPSSKVES